MNWKTKHNYTLTIPELIKKRKTTQIIGATSAIVSGVFFAAGIFNYFSTGILGPLIFFCSMGLAYLINATIDGVTHQNINLLIYLKEHEK